MRHNLREVLRSFRRDERGIVTVLFAASLIMTVMLCGLTIDVVRAVHAKTAIANALDAAALAAAKGIRLQNMSAGQARALAKATFNQNYNGGGTKKNGVYADIKNMAIKIDTAKNSVDMSVDAEVKTVFGGVAGIDVFRFPSRASAIFEAKDIELSLQLDVTGSMTGSNLAALKVATNDLVDILIPSKPTAHKIRIGLAPYAAGVNAGTYAALVNGNASVSNDCVYGRRDTQYQDTDNHPTGQAVLKTALDLPDASPCPDAKILPLTDDKALLKSTVNSYAAGGITAGHLGTAWAWYLLSPNWSAVWPAASAPAAYTNSNVRKIAILMTDGDYNSVGGRFDTGTESTTFARDSCAAMKAKGITVYTVGFGLFKGSAAEQTLQLCASDPGNAYAASDAAQLRAAFRDIAESIARLRLTG